MKTDVEVGHTGCTSGLSVENLDLDAPPVVVFERRRRPDRRARWRGGQRAEDWLGRPPGALARFRRRQHRAIPWRWWKWLSSLSL